MSTVRSSVIILSGGSGKRFGADIPKQYLEVRGKRILAYSIEAFEQSKVDEIIVVAAAEYLDLCRPFLSAKVKAVIPGGQERYDSVLCGLRYLMKDPPDIALIHDGARPLIRPETINEILEKTREYGAAIAAVPCTDTIKIADEKGNITGTTDRSRTWAAQTPQSFYTTEIYKAYEQIIGSGREGITENGKYDKSGITDDAMVYQMAFPDRRVHLVHAGAGNFKITTPGDLIRADAMLTAQS